MPSPLTFAVILRFDEATKLFHQLGEGDHDSLPISEEECLWVFLARKQVVFLANNFYTVSVDAVPCVLSVFRHSRFEIVGLQSMKQFCSLIKTWLRITGNATDEGIRVGFESSACL